MTEEITRLDSQTIPIPSDGKKTSKIHSSLKSITIVRCVYAVLVLFYSFLWLLGMHESELSFSSKMLLGCIIEIFVFTSICCVALMRNIWIKPVTYIGMVHDSILAAVFVFLTGFYTSPFLYLFLIIPLYGGITLKRIGGIVGALSVSVILVVLYFLPSMISTKLIEPIWGLIENLVFVKGEALKRFVSLGIAGFGVGFLMGQLAHQYDRVQKNLIETDLQFAHLRGFYQRMLNALPIGIVIINPQNKRTLYANPSARAMIGSVLDGENALCDTAPDPNVTEWDLKHENRYFQIASFHFPLQEDNVFSGFHILDVTDQRMAQLERAKQQRLAVLGEFSAKVAHEIRNPLACISGCNEMLQSESQNDDQKEICQMMGSEIDRLNALLTDILVFSRQPKLIPTDFALRPIIEKQKSIFLRDPAYKDVPITLDIPEDCIIHADETSFCQIVMTLWRNSCEATQGKGHLEVCAYKEPLKILFKDDGPGISEDNAIRIFEPFYTTKSSGTGLGLPIARQLANDNGLELTWNGEERGFVIQQA